MEYLTTAHGISTTIFQPAFKTLCGLSLLLNALHITPYAHYVKVVTLYVLA